MKTEKKVLLILERKSALFILLTPNVYSVMTHTVIDSFKVKRANISVLSIMH